MILPPLVFPDWDMLKRLARDKHSRLLRTSVKSFTTLGPYHLVNKEHIEKILGFTLGDPRVPLGPIRILGQLI